MIKFLLFFNLLFFGNFIPQEPVVADSTEIAENITDEKLEKADFDTDKIESYKSEKAFAKETTKTV